MPGGEASMSTITVKQIIIRIALIIGVVEFCIMLLLGNIPLVLSRNSIAILDALLLVSIAAPIIYFWIINPYKLERDQANQRLADMAFSDPLTGLPNRRVLLSSMEMSLAECARHHIHAALVLIDLDEFKAVNDNYGHDAGDAVLVETSKRLKNGIRKEDIVSRLGGDEFIILIKQLNDDSEKATKEAMDFSKKIQQKLAAPISYINKTIQLNASIGIHMLDAETTKVGSAIRHADIAMYHAKRAGGGKIVLYNPSMTDI